MTDPRLRHDLPTPPGLSYAEAPDLILTVRLRLAFLVARFCAPAALRALRIIDRFKRADFLNLLRPLELLLRRFLVFEALALARTFSSASPAQRKAKIARAPSSAVDAQDSSAWRVSFAILPTPPKPEPIFDQLARLAGLLPPRIRGPLRDFYVTRPLALRLEAAIRVALDPVRCIRRLARRFSCGAPGAAGRRLIAFHPTDCDDLNFHLDILALQIEPHLAPDTS